MTQNKVNFTERHEHGLWAKYLPAISTFYARHLGKALSDETFIKPDRVPASLEYGLQGLNFLEPDKSYFNYKFALYSVGHAERDLSKCAEREPMVHNRDREKTILVGDSGGFQIATGVFKLDWATIQTPAGDKLRGEILRFLEHTADWSMTLDVPPISALPPFNIKTGLKSFEECIDVTEYNLRYFMENRIPGKTKFLNVISGSDNENSKIWYERVIPYSMPDAVEAMGYSRDRTLEGYAFAGVNMRNMRTTLERILDLRRDGMIAGKDWIHFLGIGRLDWACFLTSIERTLRKHDNPNINISFDAASPFVAAGGYALSYNYNYFKPDQLTYAMDRGIDDKRLKGSDRAMPFQGPIMERLTAGDICAQGVGDLNRQGKESKTSWDTTSYALVMAHNVHNHIQAVQEINRLADIEYATRKVDYKEWYQIRDKKSNISAFVPNTILFFNNFVETLLDPANPDPYRMLADNRAFLDHISFGDKKSITTYGSLFGEEEEVNKEHIPTGEELAGMDVDLLEDE